MNYNSPAEIRAVLEMLGVSLKKRWGQSFLVNRGVRERILKLLGPQPADTVWEIGAGLGCLTELMLPQAKALMAFEIDHGLIRFLEQTYAGWSGFELVPGDALKTWKGVLQRKGLPDKVVGNLPYSSASALIGSFAEAGFAPQRLVFTVQKELAERMSASPRRKNYSSFSVLCQYAYCVKRRFDVQPGSFYPSPEVDSTVVELVPRAEAQAANPQARAFFHELVRALFRSRRKTLWNNLLSWKPLRDRPPAILQEALAAEGIDPRRRSEELSLEELARLAAGLRSLL